jgi:hypothetical protein
MTRVSFPLYSGKPIGGTHRASHQPLAEKRRIEMDNDSDNVGGYAVPVDPMDLLQCDSCQ